MTAPVPGADSRLGRVPGVSEYESLMRQASERLESALALKTQLAEVRGAGESADGRIRAEVMPGGLLESLELDPRVRRMDSEELAQAIVDAVRAAAEDATAKSGALMESVLPGTGASIASLSDPEAVAASRERSEATINEILDSLRRGFGAR